MLLLKKEDFLKLSVNHRKHVKEFLNNSVKKYLNFKKRHAGVIQFDLFDRKGNSENFAKLFSQDETKDNSLNELQPIIEEDENAANDYEEEEVEESENDEEEEDEENTDDNENNENENNTEHNQTQTTRKKYQIVDNNIEEEYGDDESIRVISKDNTDNSYQNSLEKIPEEKEKDMESNHGTVILKNTNNNITKTNYENKESPLNSNKNRESLKSVVFESSRNKRTSQNSEKMRFRNVDNNKSIQTITSRADKSNKHVASADKVNNTNNLVQKPKQNVQSNVNVNYNKSKLEEHNLVSKSKINSDPYTNSNSSSDSKEKDNNVNFIRKYNEKLNTRDVRRVEDDIEEKNDKSNPNKYNELKLSNNKNLISKHKQSSNNTSFGNNKNFKCNLNSNNFNQEENANGFNSADEALYREEDNNSANEAFFDLKQNSYFVEIQELLNLLDCFDDESKERIKGLINKTKSSIDFNEKIKVLNEISSLIEKIKQEKNNNRENQNPQYFINNPPTNVNINNNFIYNLNNIRTPTNSELINNNYNSNNVNQDFTVQYSSSYNIGTNKQVQGNCINSNSVDSKTNFNKDFQVFNQYNQNYNSLSMNKSNNNINNNNNNYNLFDGNFVGNSLIPRLSRENYNNFDYKDNVVGRLSVDNFHQKNSGSMDETHTEANPK